LASAHRRLSAVVVAARPGPQGARGRRSTIRSPRPVVERAPVVGTAGDDGCNDCGHEPSKRPNAHGSTLSTPAHVARLATRTGRAQLMIHASRTPCARRRGSLYIFPD
jgi:hypothetical protein